jgi:hypothetical protein
VTSDAIQAAAPRASFDVGKVLGLTFAALGRNWMTLVILAIPLTIIPLYLQSSLMTAFIPTPGVMPDPRAMLAAVGPILLVSIPIGLVLQPLFESSVAWMVWADESGTRPDTWTALGASGRQFGWIVLAAFLRGALVVLGLMLFIVPGIIVWTIFCLTLPACVVEKRNAVDAMSRSLDLTRGHRWSLFLLFFVYVILAIILGLIVGIVGGLVMFSDLGRSISLLLRAISSGFTGMLLYTGMGCAYVELRKLKEGLGAVNVAQVFA